MDLKQSHPSAPPAEAAPAPCGSRQFQRGGLAAISMGSVALLVPLTADAADFLREECESEPWQWTAFNGGDALAVEPACADDILSAWEARQ